MFMFVDEKVKKAEMSVVVIRKDGSREDLGVVAQYDKSQKDKSFASRIRSLFRLEYK